MQTGATATDQCGRFKLDKGRNFIGDSYFPMSCHHYSLWHMDMWEKSWLGVCDPLLEGFTGFGVFLWSATSYAKQQQRHLPPLAIHLLAIDAWQWLLSFYQHLSPGAKRPVLTCARGWLDATGRSGQAIKTFGLLLHPWLTAWACLVTISTSLISKLVMKWLILIECLLDFIR